MLSSKNQLQHIHLPDTTGSSNMTRFCGQMKLKKFFFFGRKHKMGLVHTGVKKVPHVYNKIYCWIFNVVGLFFCQRSLISCSDGMMDYIKYQQIKNQNLFSKKSFIMGHRIFHQDNDPKTKIKAKWVIVHKSKLLQWLSQSSELNSIENEWVELKRSTSMELWIWRICRDSGCRTGLWSLAWCSSTSSGITGDCQMEV